MQNSSGEFYLVLKTMLLSRYISSIDKATGRTKGQFKIYTIIYHVPFSFPCISSDPSIFFVLSIVYAEDKTKGISCFQRRVNQDSVLYKIEMHLPVLENKLTDV
uniref:Uncharacterized protein n=1 Tax=Anolis carolinensis TaxID=28377 RepID=A0A803TYI1_ANOCA